MAGLLFERSASNRTFLGLSGQEQNETLLGIAEEAAQRGDVDLVDAILNGTRTGAKGETLPALMKIAGLSSKGARLMDIARSRQTEKIERESYPTYQTMNAQVAEGAFTSKEAEPLIQNGTLTAKAAAAKVAQSDANRAQIQAAEAKKQQKLAYAQAHERQRAEVLAAAAHELETYAGVTNIQDVEIVSKTGEGTQKITKKEIVDAAIGRKEQELQDKRAKLIEGGSSEDDADLIVNRDRATFYAANGLDNDAWDMQFNNIAGMVGIDALTKGGAPAKQATDIAELYLQVKAVNPAYAEGTVKNARAREFFEVYDVGRNVSRLPPEQAALAAASWVAKPEIEKARDRIKNEERDEIAAQVLGGSWFSSLDDERANRNLVRSRVEQLARMGHPAGVIQKRTEDWIKSSTVAVNGVLVETKGRTPADFKAVAEKYLSDLQNRNANDWGLEDEADGDLFLVPTPSGGRWFIWSKTMDVPLGTLGAEQLAEVRQKFQQEKAQRAVEIARKAGVKRAERGRRKKAEQDQAAQLRKETQEALDQRFGSE